MSQVTINDGMTGLNARNAINGNFAELYGLYSPPVKIAGMSGNINQAIAANTYVSAMFISPVSGGPVTLRIGTTANGQDLMPDTPIDSSQQIKVEQYFAGASTIYFTFTSGAGTLNVRIDMINNYN